jgi:hypothetical protein
MLTSSARHTPDLLRILATPKHYGLFDDTAFIIGPTPDASYEVELHYGYYPESIVTAGTTWLGNEFDSALLKWCFG